MSWILLKLPDTLHSCWIKTARSLKSKLLDDLVQPWICKKMTDVPFGISMLDRDKNHVVQNHNTPLQMWNSLLYLYSAWPITTEAPSKVLKTLLCCRQERGGNFRSGLLVFVLYLYWSRFAFKIFATGN